MKLAGPFVEDIACSPHENDIPFLAWASRAYFENAASRFATALLSPPMTTG